MEASKLIKLIPEHIFQEFALKTGVDTQVKILSDELILKLILFYVLNSEKLSLRVMEEYLHSVQFKLFKGYDILDGKYDSTIWRRPASYGARFQLYDCYFLLKLFSILTKRPPRVKRTLSCKTKKVLTEWKS